MKLRKALKASQLIRNVVNHHQKDKITIGDLMTVMDVGGFGLVLLIFSLPIIVPMPPPMPSIIALPLIIFSLQMFIGMQVPKLPKFLTNITISRSLLAIGVEKTMPFFHRIEKLLKPRMQFFDNEFLCNDNKWNISTYQFGGDVHITPRM